MGQSQPMVMLITNYDKPEPLMLRIPSLIEIGTPASEKVFDGDMDYLKFDIQGQI